MKLLLDEMFSPDVAQALRDRGHSVEAISGSPNLEGSDDDDVMRAARSQRRALVTNNVRDFRPRHHRAIMPGEAGHFGMIFMPGAQPRSKADLGRIVATLEREFERFPGEQDLKNRETWLAR